MSDFFFLLANLEGEVEVKGKGGALRVWVSADAGALDGLARRAGHAAAVARLQEVGARDADHRAKRWRRVWVRDNALRGGGGWSWDSWARRRGGARRRAVLAGDAVDLDRLLACVARALGWVAVRGAGRWTWGWRRWWWWGWWAWWGWAWRRRAWRVLFEAAVGERHRLVVAAPFGDALRRAELVAAVNTLGRVNRAADVWLKATVAVWVRGVVAAPGSGALVARLGHAAVSSVGWVHSAARGWRWRDWRAWRWRWGRGRAWSRWACLGNRVRRLHRNAADAGGRNATCHHNVARRTPGGAPRVLHDPVVGSVANDEDAVVEPRAARAREGAGRVVLEASLVSFNGDGDWALGNGECKLILAVLRDVGERGEGGGVGAFLGVVASFVLFLVWVVCFGIEALVKKKKKMKKRSAKLCLQRKKKVMVGGSPWEGRQSTLSHVCSSLVSATCRRRSSCFTNLHSE